MQNLRLGVIALALVAMLLFPFACVSQENAPRLDKETLNGWLTDPQVIVLDVRAPNDWQSSDKKIKGAVRQDPKEVKTWAANLPKDKKTVLYCA